MQSNENNIRGLLMTRFRTFYDYLFERITEVEELKAWTQALMHVGCACITDESPSRWPVLARAAQEIGNFELYTALTAAFERFQELTDEDLEQLRRVK